MRDHILFYVNGRRHQPSGADCFLSLSDFLRLTLEADQRQSVPLARELQSLESYLAIQRMRFHNRLETQWQVADDALDAAVPHLILQPLVENALQHGLLPLSGVFMIHR